MHTCIQILLEMDTGLYTILFGDTIQRLSLSQTVFLSAGILNAAGPVETKSEIVWNVLLLELDCLHVCRDLHWKESRWLELRNERSACGA